MARTEARQTFLDPAVLARLENLELVARVVVDGFISGLHRSPYLGLSLDFAEHRAYEPGDDIRRVDWRVYARTDRYYVKQFEADTNANFMVALDVSASMGYGRQVSKLDYGRFLAASLSYFSHRQRDRVGMVTFAEDVVDYVPPSAKHMDVVLHALQRTVADGRGALARPLAKLADGLRRRGIIVVVSDLYEEPASVLDAIKDLRYGGNDVIVFHLLDRSELDFDFEGSASYRDLETGARLPVAPERMRERYRELVEAHTAELARRFTEARIDYTLMPTDTPLDHALFRYLSARERLSRVR